MKLSDFVRAYGLTLQMYRVPSRDMIKYSATLCRGDQSITFEFSTGCGWLENKRTHEAAYSGRWVYDPHTGRIAASASWAWGATEEEVRAANRKYQVRVPSILDVLESLRSETEGLECYSSFEEWASDFGYNPDSRKAERIWRACLKMYDDLLSLLGDDGMYKFLHETEEEET